MNKKSRLIKRQRDLRRKKDRDIVSPARYGHLDSLRGIAALAVVFSHLFDMGVYQHVTPGQLAWWYAAHQAVILFFVLSGFVLSIPFHEGRQLPYHLFASRRFIRIWVPYIVVVLATFVWRKLSNENSVPAMPLDPIWQAPLTWHLLFSYLLLIGSMNFYALVPQAWSLVYEMRISFLFPFVFLICSRLSWRVSLLVAIFISLGANLACTLLAGHGWVDDYNYAPFQTLHYAAMFITGILLARHRARLIAWEQSLTKSKLALFYLATFILYVFPFYNPYSDSQRMLGDLPTMFGSAGLIILALSSGRHFFGHPLPLFLGRISYSLYLVHLPIMLAVANSFFLKIPTMALYLIVLGAVLIGAIVFWHLVERPSLAWSRAIGRSS
jgi:peptidoglycan/LPS O-acetylase OafA/YrhL